MGMRRVVLMVLLAVLCNRAMAGWLKVESNETLTLYVETNDSTGALKISKAGNIVKIWTLLDLKTAGTNSDGKEYMSMKLQNEYSCKENQMRTVFLTSHSKNMGKGAVVDISSNLGKWMPVEPDSLSAHELLMVCTRSLKMQSSYEGAHRSV